MPTQRTMLLLPLLCCILPLQADTWYYPKPKSYFSANKVYRLDVVPRSQAIRPPQQPDFPHAHLFKLVSGVYKRLNPSPMRLYNHVAPVHAIVADDSAYFVGFDEWAHLGGDTSVVVYRGDGTIIRSLALSDFIAPGVIESLIHTSDSIQWGGTHRFDEDGKRLILQIRCDYGPRNNQDIRIDLATGTPLERKTRTCPSAWKPQITVTAEPGAPAVVADALRSAPPYIRYPFGLIGKGIKGAVVAEVFFKADGVVQSIEIRSGDPAFHGSVYWGLREFRLPASGEPVEARVQVQFDWIE